MSKKWCTAAAVSLISAAFATNAFAAPPYQIELAGSMGQSKTKSDFGKNDADTFDVSVKYYLQIVDTPSGPLAERAFTDKSAYLEGSFDQINPDRGEDTDSIQIGGRFVTDTDLILELSYEKEDDGSREDAKKYEFGVGKYLDGQTTAVVSYEKEDDVSDVSTITGEYKKLIPNESTGTTIAALARVSYIDTERDSGYSFGGGGTYYFSDIMSAGAFLDYTKIKKYNRKIYGIGGSYFFAENMFVNGTYAIADDSNDVDVTNLNVGLGIRF